MRVSFSRLNPQWGSKYNKRELTPVPQCMEMMLNECVLPNAKRDQSAAFKAQLAADVDTQKVGGSPRPAPTSHSQSRTATVVTPGRHRRHHRPHRRRRRHHRPPRRPRRRRHPPPPSQVLGEYREKLQAWLRPILRKARTGDNANPKLSYAMWCDLMDGPDPSELAKNPKLAEKQSCPKQAADLAATSPRSRRDLAAISPRPPP